MIAATYHPSVAHALKSVSGAVLLQYLVEATLRAGGPVKMFLRPGKLSAAGETLQEALGMEGKELDNAIKAASVTTTKERISDHPDEWSVNYRGYDGMRVFHVNLPRYARCLASMPNRLHYPSRDESEPNMFAPILVQEEERVVETPAPPVRNGIKTICPTCSKTMESHIPLPDPSYLKMKGTELPALSWEGPRTGIVSVVSRGSVMEAICPHCKSIHSLVLLAVNTKSASPVGGGASMTATGESEAWDNVKRIIEEENFRNVRSMIIKNADIGAHEWVKVWAFGEAAVRDILRQMDNYPLNTYKNAATTANNWLKRRLDSPQPQQRNFNGR